MTELKIPATLYDKPPRGGRARKKDYGHFLLPFSVELRSKIGLLSDLELGLTIETLDKGMVNVSLEDADFDYKFEMYPNDVNLPQNIAQFLLAISKEDYERKKDEWRGRA